MRDPGRLMPRESSRFSGGRQKRFNESLIKINAIPRGADYYYKFHDPSKKAWVSPEARAVYFFPHMSMSPTMMRP